MRKIIVALTLLVLVGTIAGAAFAVRSFNTPAPSPVASDCCTPDCCYEGSPCCFEGSPCCTPDCCTTPKDQGDSCATGEGCRKPPAPCCDAGSKD
jgi:hypothetical protein